MITFFWYLLKVCISILVFYTFYHILLRNCTFFKLNRLYLLTGLVFSFIIPILKFSLFNGPSGLDFSEIFEQVMIDPEVVFLPIQNSSNGQLNIHYPMVLSAIYLTGVIFLFFRLLLSIISIVRIKRNAEKHRFGKMKIVKMDLSMPFSFFNTVFLPREESNPLIIKHELAHIKQFHWFDLVLSEIAAVLLWFNPFVVLYKRSLKLQHEYLADASVIRNNNQLEDYLNCLLHRVQVVSSGELVSHFYCKTIKKRIVMITKNKTSVKYSGVYLLALPLVCLLLFAFTSRNNPVIPNQDSNTAISAEENKPSIYPVDAKKVTHVNQFGERINPISGEKDFHYGIDLAVAEGENIMVTAAGTVVEAKFDTEKGMGNYILVKHSDVYSTFYSHLKSISVKAGDILEKGTVIGFAGSTGKSTGSHLHYEVIKNGIKVNPQDYLPK